MVGITFAIPGYMLPDIFLIGRDFRPLSALLGRLRGEDEVSKEEAAQRYLLDRVIAQGILPAKRGWGLIMPPAASGGRPQPG